MERVFENLPGPVNVDDADGEDTNYQARIRAMIEDARDFNLTDLAPEREESAAYYEGSEPFLDEEGRSTIVATEVRDTVMAILPSLMRIFTSSEHVVEYLPKREDQVGWAEQATQYVEHIFWEENDGFLMLHSIIKDALIKNTGAVIWWTDTVDEVFEKKYGMVTMEQAQYLAAQEDFVEFVDVEIHPNDPTVAAEVTVKFQKSKPQHFVEAVPPDELRIDRSARTARKSTLIGRERLVHSSELVEMGYDKELVERFQGSTGSYYWSEERYMRNPGMTMEGTGIDAENGQVLYGEYYIRIDKDGDGIAELRRICTMGDSDEIVSDEMCETVKMALFCPDPEPHTAIGHSVSELVKDLQRIKTNVLRTSLDSLASSIFPRLVVNETLTNMEDVLNQENGAPIRTRGDASSAVNQLPHTFVGEPALGMMAYLDLVRQTRTGITEASKGVDPKALQSTSVKGIDMIITGAQERIELIARILCETGMKDMFRGLLKEITEFPNEERIVRLRGEFVSVNIDQFDPSWGVRVNPAVGRGSDNDRMALLSQIKMTQENIIEKFGVSNPMVSPAEYRNTIEDILAIGNIRSVGRYFKPIDEGQMEAIKKAEANKPDPAYLIAMAEHEKIKAQTMQKIADADHRQLKLQLDDDFRRDKLNVDTDVKSAQITAQFAGQVDTAAIKAQNAVDLEALRSINGQVEDRRESGGREEPSQ